MATSSICFRKKHIYVCDSELGNFIKAVTEELIESKNYEADWLASEISDWCDNYENMPPGLKDIELDKCLTENYRITLFLKILKETSITSSSDLTKSTIKKVLNLF